MQSEVHPASVYVALLMILAGLIQILFGVVQGLNSTNMVYGSILLAAGLTLVKLNRKEH